MLAASISPASFCYALLELQRGYRRVDLPLTWLAASVYVILISAWLVTPQLLRFGDVRLPLIGAGVVLGLVVLAMEYVFGSLVFRVRTGRFPSEVRVAAIWTSNHRTLQWLVILAIAAGEEGLYRGIWLNSMLGTLGSAAAVAILISALAYGLNHLAFGPQTVASKTLTGVVLGAGYVLAGGSLIVPVSAHLVQNTCLLWLGRDSA